jgi:molybdopterin converting factor small subunit
MKIQIEFTGISRILTGKQECSLTLEPGNSLREIIVALAKQYPALKGEVIDNDGQNLVPTNLFSLNGQKILHENNLDFTPNDGDKLILLSLLAGG